MYSLYLILKVLFSKCRYEVPSTVIRYAYKIIMYQHSLVNVMFWQNIWGG